MQKKAQAINLGSAPKIILLVTVLIMVMGTSALMINNFKTSSTSGMTSTGSVTDSNTKTVINNSVSQYFADYDAKNAEFLTCSVTIYNASNAADITASFTVSNCYATLKTDANINLNNTVPAFNYTATYTTYLTGYNISETGEGSLDNVSDQIPTLGTILGVALVLFVVFGAFMWILGGKMGGAL